MSGVIAPPLLTSSLDVGEWSASQLCRFTPGDRAQNTLRIKCWVNSEADVDVMQERKIAFPCCESNPLAYLLHRLGESLLHFICNNKKGYKVKAPVLN